jgi:hypothetical protein
VTSLSQPQIGAITSALLAYGEQVDRWKLIRALNEEASRLVYEDSFAFALGASLDRGIPAEVAWTYPLWIRERLGHLDPRRIADMSIEEIGNVLDSLPRRPRYRRDAPSTVQGIARVVLKEADGDAAALVRGRTA